MDQLKLDCPPVNMGSPAPICFADFQQAPLDLSTKKSAHVEQSTPPFDLHEFYQTYYYISLRNYNAYMANLNVNADIYENVESVPRQERKRKSAEALESRKKFLKPKRKWRKAKAAKARAG